MAVILTFLFTTALWAGLLALALRRVVRHMQANPDGVKALSEHVLCPLFGKSERKEEKPEVKKAKGTLV